MILTPWVALAALPAASLAMTWTLARTLLPRFSAFSEVRLLLVAVAVSVRVGLGVGGDLDRDCVMPPSTVPDSPGPGSTPIGKICTWNPVFRSCWEVQFGVGVRQR
jgi:hypothetical protein